jgi:hypothetical protein
MQAGNNAVNSPVSGRTVRRIYHVVIYISSTTLTRFDCK